MEKTQVYTINAKGRKLGRIATEASSLLSGKTSTAYAPNKVADVCVKITNASQMDLPAKKRSEKQYARYSGYPGGLAFRSMEQEIRKHGHKGILEKAVYGMLPANKLRSKRLKNLIISE